MVPAPSASCRTCRAFLPGLVGDAPRPATDLPEVTEVTRGPVNEPRDGAFEATQLFELESAGEQLVLPGTDGRGDHGRSTRPTVWIQVFERTAGEQPDLAIDEI